MGWNKDSIDNFFYKNNKKLVKNNCLIEYADIKKLGKEYYNWYQVIVRDYNDSYKGIEEFRNFHGLGKPTRKKWNNSSIQEFFDKNKNKLVIGNELKSYLNIKKLGKTYYNWYQGLIRNIGVEKFKIDNGLNNYTDKYQWSITTIEKFLEDNLSILTNDKELKNREEICELGSEFKSWHNVVSGIRGGAYNSIEEFKEKYNLL